MTKKTNYAETHPREYEQGQRARVSGISTDDAPYDTDTDALKAWEAGYKSQDGAAARNETSSPDEEPKAGDQLSMAAGANKAKAKP